MKKFKTIHFPAFLFVRFKDTRAESERQVPAMANPPGTQWELGAISQAPFDHHLFPSGVPCRFMAGLCALEYSKLQEPVTPIPFNLNVAFQLYTLLSCRLQLQARSFSLPLSTLIHRPTPPPHPHPDHSPPTSSNQQLLSRSLHSIH